MKILKGEKFNKNLIFKQNLILQRKFRMEMEQNVILTDDEKKIVTCRI